MNRGGGGGTEEDLWGKMYAIAQHLSTDIATYKLNRPGGRFNQVSISSGLVMRVFKQIFKQRMTHQVRRLSKISVTFKILNGRGSKKLKLVILDEEKNIVRHSFRLRVEALITIFFNLCDLKLKIYQLS